MLYEFGGQMSWLEIRLRAEDGDRSDTTLELVHEAIVDPEFWGQFGPGAVGVGWDGALRGLALHLDSGEALDPAEVEAWTLSPEGVAFTRAAANDWGEAAIADGDDPAAARAAAETTLAFYTTPPSDEPTEQPGEQ